MYIYKLHNFIENVDLLFTAKGITLSAIGIYHTTQNSLEGRLWYNKKGKEYSMVTSIDQIYIINFNDLPTFIQGLFVLNKHYNTVDFLHIKKILGYYKWQKFLKTGTPTNIDL